MTIAIYTGTFDPVTLGHLDIIHRASKIFDNLIVAVAHDNCKKTLFSDDERRQMIEESLISQVGENEAKKIKIVSFSGLLVNFAKKNKAQVLIRGLRAVSDFEYEFQMSIMNAKLADEIQTIFLPASENMHFIASKMVKEVARLGGDISKLVTKNVKEKLIEKQK